MKRYFFGVAFALIASMTCVNAQSPLSAPSQKTSSTRTHKTTPSRKKRSTSTTTSSAERSSQPKRTVLYTLGAGEELYIGECNVALKSGKKNFVCITHNKNNNKYSLIYNGTTKVSGADDIYAESLDPDNFANCNYIYEKNGERYAIVEGETYGPYDCSMAIGAGPEAGVFSLYRNDQWTSYYKVQPINLNTQSYMRKSEFEPKKLTSVNGKHTLIATGFNTYIVDGTKYTPLTSADKYSAVDIMLYPSGDAVLRFIDNNYNSDYFSLKNGKSLKKPANKEFRYSDGAFVDQLNEGDVFMGWSVYCNPEWESAYNYVRKVKDRSGYHNIETSGLYNFVMIDDKSYGKSCALNVWYSPEDNAFRWTAIEGNEVVLYNYPL